MVEASFATILEKNMTGNGKKTNKVSNDINNNNK